MEAVPVPAFGICGWSGSGKTTLLLELVRHFSSRGLRVAVIKRHVHGLDVDREGKDSDRLFRSGADVVLFGAGERMDRGHLPGADLLPVAIDRLDAEHDLILIEGSKPATLGGKVWLQREATEPRPPGVPGIDRVLAPDDDRTAIVTAMVDDWLWQRTRATPLCAGVLCGGRSERMGRPKHLLPVHGMTWLEHIVATVRPFVEQVVLLGGGEVPVSLRALPVLPDVPEHRGPLAGMLAAMRWRPGVSWLFSACDHPRISSAAVDWLTDQRVPGAWAIMPRLGQTRLVEPLFAVYEFRARPLLERSCAPRDLAHLAGVITPEPPSSIADAWSSVNTPQEASSHPLGRTPLPSAPRSAGEPYRVSQRVHLEGG